MKDAIIPEDADVRRILAEHSDIDEADVIRSKYSWIVVNKNNKTENK